MIERLRIVKRGTLVNPLVDYMIEYWMVNQPRPCPSKRTNATSTARLDDKGPGTVCTGTVNLSMNTMQPSMSYSGMRHPGLVVICR